jgi:SAM-dependent methyltransferase
MPDSNIEDLVRVHAEDGDIILLKSSLLSIEDHRRFVDLFTEINPKKKVLFLSAESLDDLHKIKPNELWKSGLIQNNLKWPADTNIRAEAMWQVIRNNVNFYGKNVIDIGCGTGDFLWRVFEANAIHVQGIDKHPERITVPTIILGERMLIGANNVLSGVGNNFPFDIDTAVMENFLFQPKYQIGFCFSVLPYLENPLAALVWMRMNFNTLILEFQYAGDGPGLDYIHNDTEAEEFIRKAGFENVDSIGRTEIEIRDTYRTIWKCEQRSQE